MKKIDAVIACRLNGTRLYGKPLQLLDIENNVTILESCVDYLRRCSDVGKISLAISDEPENVAFLPVAEKLGLSHVLGDPIDVLGRLVKAGDAMGSENILRVTSECPFIASDLISDLFDKHLQHSADYSSIEGLPEGSGFEIISMKALKTSHDQGESKHRSELVTSYIFENQDDFKVYREEAPSKINRPEVRITVDYPEDLIFCRKIYRDLKGKNASLSIEQIVEYWDSEPALRAPVESIGVDWGTGRLWT